MMGACMLVRREAIDQVGFADERFFLFSEETDWQYRLREAGWKVVFPGAECARPRRVARTPPLSGEPARAPPFLREASRAARGRAGASTAVGGNAAARRDLPWRAGRGYRDLATWARLRERPTASGMTNIALYFFATAVVLAPGWALARALGVSSIAATLAWSLTLIFAALG